MAETFANEGNFNISDMSKLYSIIFFLVHFSLIFHHYTTTLLILNYHSLYLSL